MVLALAHGAVGELYLRVLHLLLSNLKHLSRVSVWHSDGGVRNETRSKTSSRPSNPMAPLILLLLRGFKWSLHWWKLVKGNLDVVGGEDPL